ncbi:ABC transporter permease [Uliginosibacterium gangwonense]|uniref:ABC transporter permease n=1 Tax=Uliginosibacterium gangwonense TaxID=392736 RepID=UPI0003775A2A|nr:ABC transporter permease [Uliginosibacterium gangwonense]
MISLARQSLIHEWRKFLPAVMAVGFSGLLLLVQAALVLGIFGSAAVYVTRSSADVWVGYPGTQSVNFGRSIGGDVAMRLHLDPGIAAVEPYVWVEGDWRGRDDTQGAASVFVSGINTSPGAMMFSQVLPDDLRLRLREPGAVIVDRADLEQLNAGVGGEAWINGRLVHVIGVVDGLRGLGGVNVLASLDSARMLDTSNASPGSATYFVAKLRDPAEIESVRVRIKPESAFGPFEVWSADEFASRSQRYWLFDTGAGVAVLFMAVIVFVVGAVITSQSLLALVVASAREYATLNALGVSFTSLARVLVEQSLWVGAIGLVISALFGAALLWLAGHQGVPADMNPVVAIACAVLVMGLAFVSGLVATRGLWRADPAMLLR